HQSKPPSGQVSIVSGSLPLVVTHRFPTSNRFAVLSVEDAPAPPPAAGVPPIPPGSVPEPAPADSVAATELITGDGPTAGPPVKPSNKGPRSSVQAVRRHSDGPPVECPPRETRNPSPSTLSPRPLFPPTTAILGDSIIRHVRFFNTITRGFPGSTVTSILHELPQLLLSLPSTVTRIIVHVGFNDTSLQQSEVTKVHFKNLFDKLKRSGKAVFISGPLPSFARGVGRFSRLLSLNTWLQSASALNGFSFIDNFNLFWNRSSFYKSDGVHPSTLGSSVLAQNIQHAVQTKTTPTPM
uniref:SGNH hydrolase-type esterase domain-containing protein n=1 Tax=Sphaeramia orbicularis TaxID=375764 RepID=A0A673BKS2_9TELE